MPANTTIEKKGTNNIEVSIFGGEKGRISLILGVSGNGYKLPPVLIFKAKKDGRLEKTLHEFDELNKRKFIYIAKKMPGLIIIFSKNGLMKFISIIKII